MRPRWSVTGSVLSLAAAATWTGCAASPAGAVDSSARADDAPAASGQPPRAGGLIPGLDRGLRTRRWRVDETRLAAPLGEVLAGVAVSPPPATGLDEAVRDHLARNGLRVLTVPRASLETLRMQLAAPPRQVETWHGEAIDWRSLATGRPPAGVSVVAMGERMRPHAGGEYRLVARAWTMRMEDGPHLQVELRVDHVEPRRDGGLRLAPEPPSVRLVDGLVVELATPADLAWVIAAAPVSEAWPEPGTPIGGGAGVGGSEPGTEPAAGPVLDAAPGPGFGPPTAAIPTVGQLLLAGPPGSGERDVLILEAELPASLSPRPIADAGAAAGRGPGGRS